MTANCHGVVHPSFSMNFKKPRMKAISRCIDFIVHVLDFNIEDFKSKKKSRIFQ